MPRLPGHFLDFYLEPHNDAVRFSSLPADLGRFVDGAAEPGQALTVDGTVLQFMKPKLLADRVGHVVVSILPAVLDDVVRRRSEVRSSFFVDPFSLMVIDRLPARARLPRKRVQALLIDALADHFESIDEAFHLGATAAECESTAAQVVAECDPDLTRFAVALRFKRAARLRGERLLHYLYDVRPGSMTPATWPSSVEL